MTPPEAGMPCRRCGQIPRDAVIIYGRDRAGSLACERIEEALIVPHAGCAHTFLARLMAPVTPTT